MIKMFSKSIKRMKGKIILFKNKNKFFFIVFLSTFANTNTKINLVFNLKLDNKFKQNFYEILVPDD